METEAILMWSGVLMTVGVAVHILRIMFDTYKD